MASELVLSESEILNLIRARERSKKFVWTAGRVLMASGQVGHWKKLDPGDKKALLKDVLKVLKSLEGKGILVRRELPQGIGFGGGVGFDFVRPKVVRREDSLVKGTALAVPLDDEKELGFSS